MVININDGCDSSEEGLKEFPVNFQRFSEN